MTYRLVRGVFLTLARPWLRFRVVGRERIPASGAAVLVASHRSWLDPACLLGACPRPVSFLILDRVYAKPWARWLYRSVGAIPVAASGAGAVTGTREALRRLARGEVVGVFPEGQLFRDDGPGPLRPGAALLAVRGSATIVPLHVQGSAAAWPPGRRLPRRGRIVVRVGEAIAPPVARRGAVETLTERIADALSALARESHAEGCSG